MDYFNRLPEEISLDILSRQPVESVLECKLVCKNWRNLVRRGSFSRMHINHHLNRANDSSKLGFVALTSPLFQKNDNIVYFEYDDNLEPTAAIEKIKRLNFSPPFGQDTIFIGSTNGLICIDTHRCLAEKTIICNPVTREYITLPETSRVSTGNKAIGFGYVSSTNEYKVVRTVSVCENDTKVYIYTLGSGLGWRSIGEFNMKSNRYHCPIGTFVNEALYWLDYELEMIVAFDLMEEKFSEHLPLPPPLDDAFDVELKVLDGCLSFVNPKVVDGDLCWDVWRMEKKNDKDDMKDQQGCQSVGWSKVSRVDDRRVFAVTKTFNVLTFHRHEINIHNPKASTSERIVEFKESFLHVCPHKLTLASLKELGEEDTKTLELVEIEETDSDDDQPFN